MEAFVNEVIMAYGNWRFLMLTTVLFVVGLIFLKGYKKRVVIPLLILTAVILNPVFYNLWYVFNDRSYWRMMWMVPIIPVCVIVPTFLIEKSKKDIVKVVVLILATVVIILCGSFIYDGSRTVFVVANNPEKLPDDVVAVGEKLLEQDEYPTVVADASISVYLRQYSGRIRSPYSRSITFGTPSKYAVEIYSYLTNSEMIKLAQKMVDYDYEYLVTSNGDLEKQRALDDAGFECIEQVNDYGIYRVHGKKNEIRKYNSLHQVVSITIIDEDGNPVNGESGFSTIYYGYDAQGRKNYEYRVDVDGNGVLDSVGRAGYLSEFDASGKVIRQTFLGKDGNPLTEGAVTRACEYKNGILIRDSFFDSNNNLINIGENGYASISYEYDAAGDLSLTYYFDSDGKYVECGSSYLHEYLLSLIDRNIVIFISARDEASQSITKTIVQDMNALGLTTDLRGKYRYGYCAVITPESVREELSEEPIHVVGEYNGLIYDVSSMGHFQGSRSSIIINGQEYSKNARGLNIVIVEDGSVIESIAFDTYSLDMKVTR